MKSHLSRWKCFTKPNFKGWDNLLGGLDFTLLKIQFTSERRKTIRVVTRSWDAFSSVYQYLERVSLFSHSLSSEFLWFKFGSHSFSYVLTVHSIICVCMLFWLSSWNESGMELKLSGSYIAINCLSFWILCVCVCVNINPWHNIIT